MKIGLFGGSFDPIHCGHLGPVEEAAREVGLDRMVYLPTADPPHKPSRDGASAFARYAMVELALLDRKDFAVSTHELTPGKTAYTVETVAHFRQQRPGDELYLFLGADSFAQLHRWRRWWELAAAIDLVVLVRPGWSVAELPEDAPPQLHRLVDSERVHLVENEPIDVSSSDLRERLARGEEPPPSLLPELVLQYIQKYALYR